VLKFLLAAHLLLVVFTVGPLLHVAKTASRGIRHGDASATAAASRSLRIYGYVSVLVVIAGFGLMSQKRHGEQLGEFSDVWIWLSLLLWLLAMAVVLGELVPTLNKVTELIKVEDSVVGYTARTIIAGSVVAAIFFAIIVLMVYQPGS
jgi:uncharacterized membrane protein